MKTIQELWSKLKDVELVQVRDVEMEAVYKHCFEFDRPIITEIGCAHGASSIILAEAAQETGGGLICIDHFPEDYYGQPFFGDYARKAFVKNTKKYKMLFHLDIPSEQASGQVQAMLEHWVRPLCVLFIDGDHSYEAVKKDCELYLPLLKSGGYVAFHDYNNPAFGVKQAVDEVIPHWEKVEDAWDLIVKRKP